MSIGKEYKTRRISQGWAICTRITCLDNYSRKAQGLPRLKIEKTQLTDCKKTLPMLSLKHQTYILEQPYTKLNITMIIESGTSQW